jgi:hypothetical protein
MCDVCCALLLCGCAGGDQIIVGVGWRLSIFVVECGAALFASTVGGLDMVS